MINRDEDPVWKYKAYWDVHNALAYAAEKAEIKGKEEGKVEGEIRGEIRGEIKGKEKGKMEGKAEGKMKAATEIAIQLLLEGFPAEKTAQLTDLPLQEIEKLKEV